MLKSDNLERVKNSTTVLCSETTKREFFLMKQSLYNKKAKIKKKLHALKI